MLRINTADAICVVQASGMCGVCALRALVVPIIPKKYYLYELNRVCFRG